jgi:hypothetical protein
MVVRLHDRSFAKMWQIMDEVVNWFVFYNFKDFLHRRMLVQLKIKGNGTQPIKGTLHNGG